VIQYIFERKTPFRPPLITVRGDMWFFDKNTGRIFVWKQRINTPYDNVLVYQLRGRYFSNTHKTRFYGKVKGWMRAYYKQCIVFSVSNKGLFSCVLYNTTKGVFRGKVVIPSEEKCYANGKNYGFVIGFHSKVIIICTFQGRQRATIYDPVESNDTKSFSLMLINGITIPLRNTPPSIFSRDVYSYERGYLVVYEKENMYTPVQHNIKMIRKVQIMLQRENTRHITMNMIYDARSDAVFLIFAPGPHFAIVLQRVYVPRNGLVTKGLGKMVFRDVISTYRPYGSDGNANNFHFSIDGSFIHVIRSPQKNADVREHLVSVAVYKMAS
jgi:hypothetical protein